MKKTILFFVVVFLLSYSEVYSQTPQEQYEAFKKHAQQQYEDFRQKANQQYADFIKRSWQQFHAQSPIPAPIEEPVPPVVIPEEDRQKEQKDESKPYEEVVVVEPLQPQPQPVNPVEPIAPIRPKENIVSTIFYGTQMECHMAAVPQFVLKSLDEDSVSDAWVQLSNCQCDNLLSQCLSFRDRHKLCDWGYIQLLDSLSHAVLLQTNHPHSQDDATLLMAWLYCQSGYKMRLGREKGHLYMLFASKNVIYNQKYFIIDNEWYYAYKGEQTETMYICEASFPKEQSMTLEMTNEPQLAFHASQQRTMQSNQYPEIIVTTTVNRNLIDFYNNYPTGSVNDDIGTRWAIYANTPLGYEARQTLYPQLHNLLSGKSKLQAAEELLNFVQTALVYEYDDTVWGGDRAFFPEETLFYPYADCEDRSILFSRLVRDLLGLKVVLLYYPGHLATAVRFEGEEPLGDYLQLDDGRYYIADPTYIGAPIGVSMPSVRDEKIKVIVL